MTVKYWCPPLISRSKQLEGALEEARTTTQVLQFHTHSEDDECPGIKPDRTLHNCWSTEDLTV